MKDETRRDLLAKLGLGTAALFVGSRAARAQPAGPTATGREKVNTAALLKYIKVDRPVTVKIPEAPAAGFHVQVRGTRAGFATRTLPATAPGIKPGISADRRTLTLGVKTLPNKAIELVGLDSILVGSTNLVARLPGGIAAASGSSRCSMMNVAAGGGGVDCPQCGITDPFDPGVNIKGLTRF
jgi:hypothetical protein